MWITEIQLKQRAKRIPFDSHYMHRILSRATDGEDYLWAHPRAGVLIIQSSDPLRRDTLVADSTRISSRHVEHLYPAGSRVRLAGVICPVKASPVPGSRGVKTPRPLDQVPAWLGRRLDGAASLSDVQVSDMSPSRGVKPDGKRIFHQRASFTALATVTHPETLRSILDRGVGSGKRFGCGLVLAMEAS